MTKEELPTSEFVDVEFIDGPHTGESDQNLAIEGEPPAKISRDVEASGETAWYRFVRTHRSQGQTTHIFEWLRTNPPVL